MIDSCVNRCYLNLLDILYNNRQLNYVDAEVKLEGLTKSRREVNNEWCPQKSRAVRRREDMGARSGECFARSGDFSMKS